MAMNLIIDIGNSTSKVAVFQEGVLISHNRMETACLVDSVSRDCEVGQCEKCIISSTAEIPVLLEDALRKRGIATLRLGADTPLPFANDYKSPRTLGPDRIAAVAGALQMWRGECVLVVDAGSCVTYELLTADCHYVGGNISPGLRMRFASMHEHTARLPMVEADGPLPEMGQDTVTAMRTGAVRGLKYEIEGYIHYLFNKYGDLRVVLTGGDSEFLKGLLAEEVAVDAHLVLRGLDYILRYNEENI